MSRIETLPDHAVYDLLVRAYERLDRDIAKDGWDSNRYGWDFATQRLVRPRLCRKFFRARNEFKRRAAIGGVNAAVFAEYVNASRLACRE